MVTQPLRTAGVGHARFQNGFHQRVTRMAFGCACTRHHIAHHEHVGLQGHLVLPIAFDQFDTQRAQLIAHRRVHPGVTTGDAVTGFAGQGSQTAHECAANA